MNNLLVEAAIDENGQADRKFTEHYLATAGKDEHNLIDPCPVAEYSALCKNAGTVVNRNILGGNLECACNPPAMAGDCTCNARPILDYRGGGGQPVLIGVIKTDNAAEDYSWTTHENTGRWVRQVCWSWSLMLADPRWRGPFLGNTHGVEKLYLKCIGVSSYDEKRQKAMIACNKLTKTNKGDFRSGIF